MRMLNACDYILDKKDNFWIVQYTKGDKAYGNLVFAPNSKGERFNHLLNKSYIKVINQNQNINEIKNIKKVFKPRPFFNKNYKNLIRKWKKLADALIFIGINKNDIGIYGSYLIGFDIKRDIDFVIYGKSNYKKLLKKIELIRRIIRAKKISSRHINYQAKKYQLFLSKKNNFEQMLKNKWSSLQISKNNLATLRFVYKNNEIKEDTKLRKGKSKIITGRVLNSLGASLIPRTFSIKYKNKTTRVLTYFWAYQSCVKDKQRIRIFGEYNKTMAAERRLCLG
ncbi:MAG: hypothetical protein NTZ83_03585 [Candidatus Pacearchaeota archaeon]|nr:hypothetical protein [Candidatus Pacearchaeota archaeon]